MNFVFEILWTECTVDVGIFSTLTYTTQNLLRITFTMSCHRRRKVKNIGGAKV